MKKYLFLVVSVLATMGLKAQDTIIFRNGDELKVKITEVTDNQIKYHLYSNPNGAVFTKSTADIFMVKYEGGHREVYKETTPQRQQMMDYTQNNTIGYRSGHMEESHGDLKLNGRKLSDDEIRQILGEEGLDTYTSASRQRGGGKALIAIGWIETATGILLAAISDGDEDLLTYGTVGIILGQIELPIGYVLRGIGNGRISGLADNYNQSQTISLSVSPMLMTMPNNMGGSQVAMGAGLQLRF